MVILESKVVLAMNRMNSDSYKYLHKRVHPLPGGANIEDYKLKRRGGLLISDSSTSSELSSEQNDEESAGWRNEVD